MKEKRKQQQQQKNLKKTKQREKIARGNRSYSERVKAK